MGYSSNKKFSPLTDNIGLVIDGCGDTYEKKYYFNGTYIDLCGLSIEEYMKNPCCCGGNSNEETKQINEIVVKSFKDETDTIYYQAFASFSVASNIKVSVFSSNNIATELDLYVGDTQSKPEIGETLEFLNVTLNMREDEMYEYVPVTEINKTTNNIYSKAIPLKNLGDFSDEFSTLSMKEGSTDEIKFIIPKSEINYNDMTDMEEFEAFCNENQYCLALCLPKHIYDNKKYIISNYGGSDISNNFKFEKTLLIDDTDYAYLVEKANEDIMPFVPLYNEELVYEYKLTLNK